MKAAAFAYCYLPSGLADRSPGLAQRELVARGGANRNDIALKEAGVTATHEAVGVSFRFLKVGVGKR